MTRSVNLSNADALYAWLAECAEAGAACPTNDAISERFDFGSPSSSTDLMAALARQGRISVEVIGRHRRYVTILATGKRTGEPKGKPKRAPAGAGSLARTRALAAQVAREAAEAGERRALARSIGTVTRHPQLTIVERVQSEMIDGPGEVVLLLKRCWPHLWHRILWDAREAGVSPVRHLVGLIAKGVGEDLNELESEAA